MEWWTLEAEAGLGPLHRRPGWMRARVRAGVGGKTSIEMRDDKVTQLVRASPALR